METQVELILDLYRMESANGSNFAADVLQKIEERLDPSLLKYYRRIKERRGSGVAVLKDRTCSECRMVYPEAHSTVQCKNLIHKCEYCGRLLVASRSIERAKPRSALPFVALPVSKDSVASSVTEPFPLETVKDAIDPAFDLRRSREMHEAAPAIADRPKPLILHVDHDQRYRKIIKRALERAGFSVIEAGSGREALEQLAMQDIGLVISELTMPECDGFEMMEEIGNRQLDIPVIFVTSLYDDDCYLNAMLIGAYDCISKSNGEKDILRIVRNAMNAQIGAERGKKNDRQ